MFKRFRELDDYERETLIRLCVIILGLVVAGILGYIALSLSINPTEQPEPIKPHFSPFPIMYSLKGS